MKLPSFEYRAPTSAQEAVALLASHLGTAKLIAGGQSLLPSMAFRLARPSLLVDLRKLHVLRHITLDACGVTLGACVRWCDIENDTRLGRAHPLLVEAIRHVAHYPIRNRGTIGGSLAHADPAAEMPCIAVTCDATLRLISPRGERRIAASEFLQGPLTTALAEDEMILDVLLPAWPATRRFAFEEFAMRPGDFALAGVALHYDIDINGCIANAHLGVFGAVYCPMRIDAVEQALNGTMPGAANARHAAELAMASIDTVGDMHADADYRRALVGTLLERALAKAGLQCA